MTEIPAHPVAATPRILSSSENMKTYFDQEAERPESWAALSVRQTREGNRLITLISERDGVVTNHSRAVEGLGRDTAEEGALWASALEMAHDVLGSLDGLPLYFTGQGSRSFIVRVAEVIPGLDLRILSGVYFREVIKPMWGSMITAWMFDPTTSECSLGGKMYRQSKHNTTSSQARSFLVNPKRCEHQEKRYRQLTNALRRVPSSQQARPSSVIDALAARSRTMITESRTIHLHTDASRNIGFAEQVGYGLGVCLQDGERPVEFYSCYEHSTRGYQSHEFEFSGAMRSLAAISRTYDVSEDAVLTIHLHCDNDWTVQRITALNKLTSAPEELQRELKDALSEEKDLISSAWMSNPRIQVRASWVKGHVGNTLNEACDRLAKSARHCQEMVKTGSDHVRLLTKIRTELRNFHEITPSFTVPSATPPQKKVEPRVTVVSYTPDAEALPAEPSKARDVRESVQLLSVPQSPAQSLQSMLGSSGVTTLVRSPLELEIVVKVSGSVTETGYGMGVAIRRGQQAFRHYSSFEPADEVLSTFPMNFSGMVAALEAALSVTQVTGSGRLDVVIRSGLTPAVSQFNRMLTMNPEEQLEALQRFTGQTLEELPFWLKDSRLSIRAGGSSNRTMGRQLLALARNVRAAENARLGAQRQWETLKEINSAVIRHEESVIPAIA